MLKFLLSPFNKAVAYLGVALVFVLGLLGWGASKKRQGADAAKTKQIKQDAIKGQKAREAAFKEKRDVNGLSDSDLIDRLRRRDGDWGNL
jgi:hypothetical protein